MENQINLTNKKTLKKTSKKEKMVKIEKKNDELDSEKEINKINEDVKNIKIKEIKEKINKEVKEIKSTEKKTKTKIELSCKNKLNYDNVLDNLLLNTELNSRLVNFINVFKNAINNNNFNQDYFQNLTNLIYNYKQIISFLSYLKAHYKQVEFEINSIFDIPKNLINNNIHIFEETKYELQKKNTIFYSKPILIDNIYVEEKYPVVNDCKYLLEHVSLKNINDFVNTVYISWVLSIIHVHIFNTMIKELTDEEKNTLIENNTITKLNYYEKYLEKFISINNDTNIYIKLNISFLKKKVIKSASKIENKQEKIINQDISSIKNTDIRDENDENTNVKNFNLQNIDKNSDSSDLSDDSDDEK